MTPPPLPQERRWRARALLVVMALGVAVSGVIFPIRADDDNKAEGPAGTSPSRVTTRNGLAVLTISAAEQQASGIETAAAQPAPLQDWVVGYGIVLDPAPLTELSNRYREAASQAETAAAKLAVSRAAFERAQVLYKDRQNISAAQLQGAEGSFAVDKALLDAAQSHQESVAASARQAWGSVLGAALIERGELITRLMAREEYLVKVTLPPGAAVAQVPETATAQIDRTRELQLTYLSPATTIDARLQAISYLYRAAAQAALLPGMNLEARLPVEASLRGLVVPEAAVVWLQGKAWIYQRTAPDTFVRREIGPDHAGPDGGYIVTGLPPDAQIVVRGAQMLLSEEFRAQVPIED